MVDETLFQQAKEQMLGKRQGERGIPPVIDHLRGAEGRAFFEEIDPDPGAAPRDPGGVDAPPAQGTFGGSADLIVREAGDDGRRIPESRESDCHIGLRAPVDRVEGIRLRKPVRARRGQTEQDFTETDDHRKGFFLSRMRS